MVDRRYSFTSITGTSLEVKSVVQAHRKLVGSLTLICNLKWKAPILSTNKSFKLSWLNNELQSHVWDKKLSVVVHSLITDQVTGLRT